VLAPGGVFHLNVPCEGDACCLWRWLPGQAGERGLKRRFAGHLWRFRRRDVLDSLRAAGFAPVRTRHSLHVIGNLADVAAFAAIALRARARPGARPPTTGDLLARAAGGSSASASGTRPAVSRARRPGALGRLVRAADAALELEARCLARIPSWGLHVSVRADPPP
jgi:hypothetical protein